MTVEEEMKIIEEHNKAVIKQGRLLYSYEIREILDKFIQEGEWQPLSLKTLNGDDIAAYECSCCKAIVDKKYKCCPKCNVKMKGVE